MATADAQTPISQSWEAIFFDFDGVLADSVNVKTQAFRSLYADYNHEIQDAVVNYHLKHGGMSRYEKIRYYESELLHDPPSDERVTILSNRFSELVKEAVVASQEIDGASEVLRRFSSFIPLFIVSGTPEDELQDIVKRRGIRHHFQAVRGSPTQKQDLVNELLTNFDVTPKNCVLIGDSMTDFEAAAAHDIEFIGIKDRDSNHPFPNGTIVFDDLRPLIAAQ